jgi:winged helix domain-containing protein/ATPase family protein associated with various cellular activities (AAA)
MIRGNTNWEHLIDELELLNFCLLREARRRPHREPNQFDYLQGLVLNEQEILAILTSKTDEANGGGGDRESDHKVRQIEESIAVRRQNEELRMAPALIQAAAFFGLGRLEEQCLVLCLAPEIDSKYSKVFAFLQDDVTKKQPSVDLALRLFCSDLPERIAARTVFSPGSSLLKNRLIHLGEAQDGASSLLQRCLVLDDRIGAFLLETPQLDRSLGEWVEFVAPDDIPIRTVVPIEVKDRAVRMVENCFAGGEAPLRPVIHLYGRPGSGRRSIAECLSQQIGLPLLMADVRRMPMAGAERVEAWWRLGRESLLLPAAVLVEHCDDLLQEGRQAEVMALLDAVQKFSPLTILSGKDAWNAQKPESLFLSVECPVPDATTRIGLWKEHLQGTPHQLDPNDWAELAGKFSFTDGQIREAVQAARDHACWESQSTLAPLAAAALHQVCRRLATPNLGGLARKVEPHYGWADIVLPEPQIAQLRELATHVKRSQLILETWGFAQKFPYGRGVTALFNGLSGTGKTMAASIIAAELGLDLYKIDLSCVVSKYIGETEKNLNRIFAEAQDSSAILFFDEADALFGKRSEVKDAHDRYANIETAYLLQRIEDYSGVVILATNMKQNMDEAFVRRMRFIIHFPFPSETERERIWEKAFPDDAPLGADVDFHWLSRKLKIAGGHIKNISLRAAFLASERRGVIGMDCLVEAARREGKKMGKAVVLGDFNTPDELALEALEAG